MKAERFVGGLLESNGYVLYKEKGGDCFIIDPGYEYKVFINFMDENGLSPEGIFLTHCHYDHVGAVKRIIAERDCPVYMHTADCDSYGGRVDVYMEDGDVYTLVGEDMHVISTPGHTEGSVCFYLPESRMMFTGDTVFDVDLGRTDLEGGSDEEMIATILDIVSKWDNDIYIYPGHGDGCTVKKMKEMNTEYRYIIDNYGKGKDRA